MPFQNLGQGSIPARNWVWDHSIKEGHAKHWILDDNIRGFYRYNNNLRIRVKSPNFFAACEDFCDRYSNVGLAGLQYKSFAPSKTKWKPFYINRRIYSCILINNSIVHRWRGKYNEDTDLSIRVMKSGLTTILFYAFLCDKMATMLMKGGNTNELYRVDQEFDGRLEMTKHLQKQHPSIVKIVRKFGHWQHHVDYSEFKKLKLIRKSNASNNSGIDEYGLRLCRD